MAIVGDPSFQKAAANSLDPVAAEIAKRAQPIARSLASNGAQLLQWRRKMSAMIACSCAYEGVWLQHNYCMEHNYCNVVVK
jgi:hypothetical protein